MSYFTLKKRLIIALSDCPSMSNRQKREAVVEQLRKEIRGAICRDESEQTDILNIVSACLNYLNGLEELIEIIEFFEQDSEPMRKLNNIVEQIRPELQTFRPPKSEDHARILNSLDQARQAVSTMPSVPQVPRKIDRNDVIIPFDLEDLEIALKRMIRYEGAFAFAVGADGIPLRDYIIPRIGRELRAKLNRPQRQVEVYLNPHDVAAGTHILEHKLNTVHGCGRFCDLFVKNADQDIVLVVWIDKVPLPYMKQLAASFWTDACAQAMPYLHEKSRCFVLIWANIGSDPLPGFTDLRIPKTFNLDDLMAHFRGQLAHCGLDAPDIDVHLARLQIQHGHMPGTLQEMLNIIQELQ